MQKDVCARVVYCMAPTLFVSSGSRAARLGCLRVDSVYAFRTLPSSFPRLTPSFTYYIVRLSSSFSSHRHLVASRRTFCFPALYIYILAGRAHVVSYCVFYCRYIHVYGWINICICMTCARKNIVIERIYSHSWFYCFRVMRYMYKISLLCYLMFILCLFDDF